MGQIVNGKISNQNSEGVHSRAGGTGVAGVAAATPILWLFQGLNKKKQFENQTKIGRLAAISNFCLILFISSKNSFCKTVCFLGPNPKFNFMRSLQFFQRSQQKRLSNSTIFIHCHIVKNFDLEKNGAEFISRNENSQKVLGNP